MKSFKLRACAAIIAPFGGLIDDIAIRKGDPVRIGDPVATIKTTKVYAEMDGTVSGIFAREGDQTEGITERYGAVMYIEPVNRYVVSATTEKAYNSSATKYIHIGEKVYLSCTKDGTHVGTAVVTKVSEVDEFGNTPYTLEVTGGEFYMGETVGIFRESDYAASSRIGRGTIQQNAAVAVKGSGSVLRLDVEVGDRRKQIGGIDILLGRCRRLQKQCVREYCSQHQTGQFLRNQNLILPEHRRNNRRR